MPLKIVINARYTNRLTTGVERYASEITAHLPGNYSMRKPSSRDRAALGHMWEQFILPLQLGEQDLLWSPANTGPLLIERQVLAVHDLAWLEHPEWYQPAFSTWYRLLLPGLISRVRMLVTVSHHTKIRIMKRFQISEDRIKVIPGGVNLSLFKPVSSIERSRIIKKHGLDRNYFLFVGSLTPGKNLSRLVQAWKILSAEVEDIDLVIAGSASRVHRGAQLSTTPLGIRYLGYVEDADLPGLYTGAIATILPSLSEGFGLTALEAMACGSPVIASAIGSLKELCGKAAVYFDPHDPEELSSRMKFLFQEEDVGEKLRQAGLQRARICTWAKAAEELWQVLQNVSR
jgi:glycosyltransferase involved in cell wall biosynthesis